MNIVLLGPPGSGKGTQAASLMTKYGVTYISTGSIFREEITKKTPLGEQVQSLLKSGGLVPDSLTIDIVLGRLGQSDIRKHFLLDGFPRTVGQAEALDGYLKKNDLVLNAVIALDVDDEEVVRRLSNRRFCGSCGRIYNLESQPPEKDGVCDFDGTDLLQRADDKPATIRKRLVVFHEQTKPLMDYYQEAGLLHTINGLGTPEAVSKAVDKALENARR